IRDGHVTGVQTCALPISGRRPSYGHAGGDPMTRRRGALVGVVVVATLLVGRAACAGPPTDQLRAHFDRVVKTLEEPALKGEATEIGRASCRERAGVSGGG